MNHNEKRLQAIERSMGEKAAQIEEVWDKAKEEERDPTEEERTEVGQLVQDIEQLKADRESARAAVRVDEEVRGITRELGVKSEPEPQDREPAQARIEDLGSQFLKSDGYKRAKEGQFAGKWTTGMIDLESKATLVEGDNLFLEGGTPGAGAPLVALDQRPGVLPLLYQRNTVASLFASGTTNSNAINYIVEATASDDARVVAEGAAKPEQTLTFDNAQETVKKIAAWLPVSDEMLEDAPALQSYINARLTLFVQNEEDIQLLHGAGGSNFRGLLPRVPVANRYVVSDADTPNNADHIYQAITVARRSFLEPDGIVVNPEDWADIRLLKDDNANYIGGSPFNTTGFGEPAETLWNKRVVTTYAMPAGTALVGAFMSAAQVFRRGGLRVEASNSHSDYFVKNLTAIRAEQREALAVYRPSAFAIADVGYPS